MTGILCCLKRVSVATELATAASYAMPDPGKLVDKAVDGAAGTDTHNHIIFNEPDRGPGNPLFFFLAHLLGFLLGKPQVAGLTVS